MYNVPQTTLQNTTPPSNASQDEIIVDGLRLRAALRRQGRLWLWLGPLGAGLLLLLLAALVPRSYTATTSVALQQSSGGGSALALLTGASGGGNSKRYLGVLKSRSLAAAVENHVHLRQLYGAKTFRTEEDAAEYLMKNVKPDDSATDGLLYVSVSLPGPPKLALHSSPTAEQAAKTAADAANDYALGLKEYYATSDTDQGAVLLRGADKEVRQARARYEDALSRSLDFTRGLSRIDPRSAPSLSASGLSASGLPAASDSSGASSSSSGAAPSAGGSGASADASTAASALAGLYVALNQVQAELSTTEAVRATGQALIGNQLRDLSNVPTDDPLLADARSRVTQDQSAYKAASTLLGPENPRVIQAQTQLNIDQAVLTRQIQGVKQNLTTPDIRSAEEIKGLYARQSVLLGQIAQAQKHLGASRQLAGEAGRLQAEVGIQLEVLKTTLSEAARVRLENASSLSRMTVIDTAIPLKSGEPGLAKLAAACVGLTLLAFLVAVAREYLRAVPKSAGPVFSPGNGTNGTAGGVTGDKEDTAQKSALQK